MTQIILAKKSKISFKIQNKMKIYLIINLSFIFAVTSFSQNKVIFLSKASKNDFTVKSSSDNVDILEINANISYLSLTTKSANAGDFIVLESDGLSESFNIGEPNIPVFSKLIELPLEASVKFKILSYDEEIIDLKANGINQPVIPAQPPLFRDQKPDSFFYDKKSYNENKYVNKKITDFEDVGILRSARLGRVIIKPIQYNPQQNKIRVLNNLRIEVTFAGSNHEKTKELKAKY
jgi:hypothetical protein